MAEVPQQVAVLPDVREGDLVQPLKVHLPEVPGAHRVLGHKQAQPAHQHRAARPPVPVCVASLGPCRTWDGPGAVWAGLLVGGTRHRRRVPVHTRGPPFPL